MDTWNTYAFFLPSVTELVLIAHSTAGSGKSVLWYVVLHSGLTIAYIAISSTIIEEVQRLRGIELVSVAYFYFDFRSDTKQSLRSLLSSLLDQLSA